MFQCIWGFLMAHSSLPCELKVMISYNCVDYIVFWIKNDGITYWASLLRCRPYRLWRLPSLFYLFVIIYELWLKWKNKQKWGSMSAGERRDRMSCGMWCFLACGSEWSYGIRSYLPGFSGASVTFSWTSLGMTKIKPNRPVNVRLLSTQKSQL